MALAFDIPVNEHGQQTGPYDAIALSPQNYFSPLDQHPVRSPHSLQSKTT